MSLSEIELLNVNLEHDAFVESVPHEMFARMRREAPVYWYDWKEGKGFWCLTKHADIREALRNWKVFSSELGGANLEDLDEDARLARQSMMETDPPRHTRLRGLVGKWFTPKSVSQYEPLVRSLTRGILDEALKRDEFDFIDEIAARLPIQVLARLLGVPPVDTDKLIAWSDRMMGNADPDMTSVLWNSPESEKYRLVPFRSPAALEVFEYGHHLAALRRKNPENDLVTKLVQSEIDGQHLTEREFDTMFLLLVVAGNETTRQAIAHGLNAFIEHPDQIEKLQSNPELISTAVEEILRWATPIHHFRRTATSDVELRGQKIKAGDKVVYWFVSANRDEEVFVDPFRFDITRSPNPHLAFGQGGPHACLGTYLAKLEIKVMYEELLPYLHRFTLREKPKRMRSNFTNNLKNMPIRFSNSK